MNARLPVVREDHVDLETCGRCGGACCKGLPGSAMPEDFGAPDLAAMVERITAALATGNWTVDWWEGDPEEEEAEYESAFDQFLGGYLAQFAEFGAPFVRPATTKARGEKRDPSFGGRCVFLSDTRGCEIFDQRPSGCRGLKPRRDRVERRGCEVVHSSKQDAAIAWKPYAEMLWRLSR